MANRKGLEKFVPVMIMEPADVNGGVTTGDYVSMKEFNRCTIIIIMGDGTAGNDLDVLLYQATSNTGGSAKVLNALETGRIYTRYAATFAALVALTTGFTEVTQAVADEQHTPSDNGEAVGLMVYEIKADDLDVANGFDYIRCDLSNPGAAKIVAGLYLMHDPRYAAAPELMTVPTS